MSQQNTIIRVHNVPFLDTEHNTTIDFSTIEQQKNYFNSKVINTPYGLGIYENCTLFSYDDNEIFINCRYNYLKEANYISYEQDGKTYYAFILNMEIRSDEVTKLIVELDPFQTYMFDYEIKESFVVRCHQDRQQINIEDEKFSIGDYSIVDKKDIYNFSDTIIFYSSVPIGKIESGDSGGGVIPSTSPVYWMDYLLDAKVPYEQTTSINYLSNTVPRVADCSASVQWSYYQTGVTIGRNTEAQKVQGVEVTSYLKCIPGDCIYFDWDNDGITDHVAMVRRVDSGLAMGLEIIEHSGPNGAMMKIRALSTNDEQFITTIRRFSINGV